MGDAATDNVVFGADVDSNIIPDDDNTYDLGSSSQQWKDIYIDGVAYLDAIDFNGTTITSTAAELNILDGVTSTAAELNILDGVTSTATELNLLDGVTATTTELNYVDVSTAGTVEASKAIVTDSNKDITGGRNITISGELDAATLDISGDVDIDGTLEADAITVNGTTLAETISDTVGAMVSSNTETNITVTYDDSDNTLDFVLPASLEITTSIGVGGGSTNGVVIQQGGIKIKNGGTQSYVDFYCESNNAHYLRLQAPAHASFSGNPTVTLPSTAGTIALTTGNVATATALATARTIHGVSFDGTANIDLTEVVQDTVGAMFSSNTESGITVTYEDSDGTIDLTVGTLNQSTTGNAATATALETARTIHGVSFDGTANIDLSEVVQDTVGAMFSSNTETGIAATYEDGDGTIDLVIGSDVIVNSMIADDAIDSAQIADGAIDTVHIADDQVTGDKLANDITIANNLSVAGNLTVTGTTTQTGSVVSDSNFTGLTDENTGNTTDFGFYGKYVESSTTKYAGLYYDASTDNTFRLFCDTQTVPSTTVNTSATGYAAGNLIVNNLTGTIATAAQTNITSVGTLSSLTISGDLAVDTSTLKVDSSNNRVGIGNASPDVSLDLGSNTDSIHIPVGTTAQRPGSPAAGYFRYNSTTGEFEGYTDAWGSIGGGSGSFSTNIFTGDDSTTAFTLSSAPSSENNLMVFIDGVFQAHNSYSVSGTTLTLSEAPLNGRVITAYNAEEVAIGTPSDNSVSTAKIAADAVTGAKIADDAIDSEHYTDGSIDTAHIGDDQVTGAKIENAVTFATSATAPAVTATAAANVTQQALTSSSNAVAWDAAAKSNAFHLTTENTTISAPTNNTEGAIISIEIAQGGTPRTVAWNTAFEFAASTAPTITATANKTDIFSFRYNGSVWQEVGRVQNLAQT